MNPEQQPQQQPQETVFMRPNTLNAKWEAVPYAWNAAIAALGHSYDLKRVMPDGTEEERSKKPNPATAKPGLPATRSNPNVEFELWWEANGDIKGNNKEIERSAFLGGWFARQAH